MTAKEYLMRAQIAKQHVRALQEELAQLALMRGSITSSIGGEIMGKGGLPHSRVESFVIRLEGKEETLKQGVEEWLAIYDEVEQAIMELVPDQRDRDLLRMRYLAGLTWEQIAEARGKDVRTVQRWHGAALAAFQWKLGPVES